MNLLYNTTRFFISFCFLFGFALGQAQTDSRCYDAANAGTVGQTGWTGCEGMYIVTDLAELKTATSNNYTITHNNVDYTFGDSTNNVFTGQVTSLNTLFILQTTFNEDIGYWDTSNVTNMASAFWGATDFNQDIGSWNTANVRNMQSTFNSASAFNQDIGSWNTAKVTDMGFMFTSANVFNQDIGDWNTANVTDMSSMFRNAVAFNQDIGSWDTAKVTTMAWMFWDATAFNQDLSGWNVENIPSKPDNFDTGATSWTNPSWRPVWGTASLEKLTSLGVLVYPNPVATQLRLVYPSATQADYTIYDLRGKQLASHRQNGQHHQLNVSSLAKGVYLLESRHGNQRGVFRFVKE